MIELYYPSILPKKDNWMKMAALYKPNLYTINPTEFSDTSYSYLNNELNFEFLKQYNPRDKIDFENFERKIISLINVLSNDESKHHFKYHHSYLDYNLKVNSKRAVLFNGKFTDTIKEALIRTHYGVEIDENIHVSQIFIIIYMGLLAQEMESQNDNIVLTAKHSYINQYQNFLKILEKGHAYLGDLNLHQATQIKQDKESFYQSIISLIVPKNINFLSFDDIRKIRTPEYIHDLTYFIQALNKIYSKNNNNDINSVDQLIKEINEPLDNLKGRLQASGVEAALNLSFNYLLSIVDPAFTISELASNTFSTNLNSFIYSGNHYTRREWRGTLSVISTLDNLK